MNICEIAEKAGVSRATVSRVINNFPGVREETRQRVEQVIRETHYIPSAAARSLVSQKSNIIGVLVYNITHPFWGGFISGVENGTAQSGYGLFFVNSKSHVDVWDYEKCYKQNLFNLIRRDVDGVIISLLNDLEGEDIELLERIGMPYVIMQNNLEAPGMVSVNVDNERGAFEATSYLIGLGHRDICHVTGPTHSTIGRARRKGFMLAMQQAGLPLPAHHIVAGNHFFKDGYGGMKQILAQERRPSAVFFSCDEAAWGGILAAREEGVRVPGDISVIGFDDIAVQLDHARMLPRLTTMRQPVQRLGELAAGLLLEWLRGGRRPDPARVIIPAELVVGETCAAPG